jgi:hypothetical protein
MTSGSFSRSLMSMFLPLLMTSGCFLLISQPMWEKKNPRLELWGSASVSLYLWCCRWSRTHMYKQFCNAIFQTIDALGCRQTIKKHHVVESNTNCFDKTRIHNGKRFRLVKLLCHRDNTQKKGICVIICGTECSCNLRSRYTKCVQAAKCSRPQVSK